MKAGELKPRNMCKRQRKALMIKEVDMPQELARYINENNSPLKRSFNKLSAAMVKGDIELNTSFLNDIGDRLKKEIADIKYSRLNFWQKCLAFFTK